MKILILKTKELGNYLPILENMNEINDFTFKGMHRVFIAKEGNEVVGFAALQCCHGYYVFRACVVSKKFRGQGIQKKLIKSRLRYLKNINVNRVSTLVLTNNIYSLNNLISCGFVFNKGQEVIDGITYLKLIRKIGN